MVNLDDCALLVGCFLWKDLIGDGNGNYVGYHNGQGGSPHLFCDGDVQFIPEPALILSSGYELNN